MTLSSGTQLGPYEIVSQLGAGGMGVVYEARDPRLKRTVAIKLLPPDLTKDATAKQRFLQEAQAASALDHPNICTIHEINETDDGQLYLVMAHYEGETLKERIEKGPLGLDDAIDIATQVGTGLAEAHGAGIVHRDIKPANLLVTKSGVVKILDFGLAKLAGTEGVTQTGTTVGTVAYMSPEQARGQEVDHRTDIWSLGVVLYEMLAGTPPFQGENLLSISNAILEREQPSLTGSSSSAQSVVTRALQKDRTRRHQAVTELLGALGELQSSPAAPTVVAAAQPDVPSIAVLPFADMSAKKDQDYFCEGMAEEIIGSLTEVEGLRVASRTSTFSATSKNLDIAEIGKRLNVSTVLEGSVRSAGNRARIAVQLTSVRDGFQLWAQRFDRDLDDIFAIQDEIARSVTQKLNVTLRAHAEGSGPRVPTNNIDAYTAYLKGRKCLRQRGPKQALWHYQTAVDLDPMFAVAHAGMADVYAYLGDLGFIGTQEAARRTMESVERALELDPTLGEAHLTMAWTQMGHSWDWQRAEQHFRRGLDLNPESSDAHSRYGCFLAWIHTRVEEGAAEAKRGTALDPLDPHAHQWLGIILSLGGRPADALQPLGQALRGSSALRTSLI